MQDKNSETLVPITIAAQAYSIPSGANLPISIIKTIISIICSNSCSLTVLITRLTA